MASHGCSYDVAPACSMMKSPYDYTQPTSPTTGQWDAYSAMFAHFNASLFGGRLPTPILNFSRHAGSLGFFAPVRWARTDGTAVTHEISINPETNAGRQPMDIASTLVHEMTHLEQEVYGKPSRGGYHNKAWALLMHAVGLQPVSYDQPGKETGCRVLHTVKPGGAFEVAFGSLPVKAMPWRGRNLAVDAGLVLPPGGAGPTKLPPMPSKKNKVKYTCGCANVWGKPGLNMTCDDCGQEFVEQ